LKKFEKRCRKQRFAVACAAIRSSRNMAWRWLVSLIHYTLTQLQGDPTFEFRQVKEVILSKSSRPALGLT